MVTETSVRFYKVESGAWYSGIVCVLLYSHFRKVKFYHLSKYSHNFKLLYVGLVPDHHSKVNIAIKRVTQFFLLLFPSACKSYFYTILHAIKYAIELCLKNNVHTFTKKYFIAGDPVNKTLPFNARAMGSVPQASRTKNQNIKQKQYCNKLNT